MVYTVMHSVFNIVDSDYVIVLIGFVLVVMSFFDYLYISIDCRDVCHEGQVEQACNLVTRWTRSCSYSTLGPVSA